MEEIWKDIEGFDGFYQVSSLGRVKGLDRKFAGKGRILKNFVSHGYLRVGLWAKGKRRAFLVHRLVATAFIENPKKKRCVNHVNGIKTDNVVKNLEWCTYSENIRHAHDNNLIATVKGVNHHNAKLDEQDVRNIRYFCDCNILTQREIGIIFQTSQEVVSNISRRKRWKHVS